MAAVEPVEAGAEGQGVEVAAAAVLGVIIGSTLTPVCPICSRALSKNTWTRCMSGRLTWQGLGTGPDRDKGTCMDLTHTPTHIHTHTRTHTGSHQPT